MERDEMQKTIIVIVAMVIYFLFMMDYSQN